MGGISDSSESESAMHCVDYSLRATPPVAGWDELLRHSFICHACEKIFKSVSKELYFFPDDDAVYHRHEDNCFYRAFTILENGVIQIGAYDSADENVIQNPAMTLNGGESHGAIGPAEKKRSREFFESMRRQMRRVEPAQVDFRIGQ